MQYAVMSTEKEIAVNVVHKKLRFFRICLQCPQSQYLSRISGMWNKNVNI